MVCGQKKTRQRRVSSDLAARGREVHHDEAAGEPAALILVSYFGRMLVA